MPGDYPLWKYYPPRARPPEWVAPIVAAFAASRADLSFRWRESSSSATDVRRARPWRPQSRAVRTPIRSPTGELKANLLAPARSGTIRARGKVVRAGAADRFWFTIGLPAREARICDF
jgi:hypothetical protein